MTQFYGKTKICYGAYALEELEALTARQAFIVTDPFMVKSGFADRVKSHLDRAGIGRHMFADVEPDPSLEMVTRGTFEYMRKESDLIIALGGGSVIDAAKAIAFFAYHAQGKERKAMLVAIPTTAGTGSEVTAISVITDKANEVKVPLNDELLIPDIAILDARFTRTAPPGVTAATGMDVLTHAVEAYTSRQANAFTSIYAEHAVRYVFTYLRRAYRCMDDMEAREMMQLGSCMAGMAFNNSGLGITHSIAHSLGGLFHIAHGLANAVMLPYVIRFNSFDVGVKYRAIAEILGLPCASVEEGTASLIQAVCDMNESMGIPARLNALKIEEVQFRKHMDAMAGNILADFCTGSNPRQPSAGDIKALLERAW
jgi:alcohol dehydrogenase class IV